MSFPHPFRSGIILFLKKLQAEIIHAFETLENGAKFEGKKWSYHEKGGGEMMLLRGEHFEKAAVNWSGVEGSAFPTPEGKGPFFATGVSVITHMANPQVPTVHMNVRFIETAQGCWFGGGYDLTPMGISYVDDTEHFHGIAKTTLDHFGAHFYEKFSQNAREYFYIPHRKKERGVGGLFFDHLNSGDFNFDYNLWQAVAHSFLKAIVPIYQRRLHQSYTLQEREHQLHCRAHYAEFNLVYDRGTKFGFQSGGNPEAILCSMPPLVKW
jgi:coproporphyrinogen III oxidase